MKHDEFHFNRSAFLTGSIAAIGLGLSAKSDAAEPASTGISPDEGLAQLTAGNARFVANDFPTSNKIAEKRELLKDTQTPFAAILSCADSRVIPELVFIQGLGQLFVTRVAGNYPDNLVTGSLEYAIEHLGTRLIVVLGHQNCGAVKAVYETIQAKTTLPPHLNVIGGLVAPGIEHVVAARGSIREATEANARAAAATLRNAPPVISKGVASGHVRVAAAYYQLGTGKVDFIG